MLSKRRNSFRRVISASPSAHVTPRAGAKLARRLVTVARSKGGEWFGMGDRLLVAVSGGPDSVALLALLAELAPSWNLNLHVLHVNHGLRGAESDEDARFVAALSDRLGIAYRCELVQLGKGAGGRRKSSSLQERAREARYEALVRVGRELGVDKVALGHTADDQAETLLMWMLRGAGTAGLAGIPPARASFFIRPLLDVTRADILEYLAEQGLAFRTDSSNAKPLYVRNRIRQELLPLLKRYNPAIVATLTRQADILREENRCLEQWVQEQLPRLSRQKDGTVLVDRAGLLAMPLALQRRMVRALLRQTNGTMKGPTFRAIASALAVAGQGQTGSSVTLQGVAIERDYGWIRFRPSGEADTAPQLSLTVPSLLRWPLTGQVIRTSLGSAPTSRPDPTPTPAGRTAVFDADLVTLPLLVRSWRAGDSFYPLGMRGKKKKLQDYFTDIKLSRYERARVPVLVAPEGILWIGGHRADHRFRVTPGTTRTLTIELLDNHSQ